MLYNRTKKNARGVFRLTFDIIRSTKYLYHILKVDNQMRCRSLLIQIYDSEDVQILKEVISKDHVHM